MSNKITDIQLSGVTYQIEDSTAIHSLDGYWTSGQTNNAITAATNALAESIAEQGYQTSGDVQSAISGKTDTSAFTAHTGDSTIHVTVADKTAFGFVKGYCEDKNIVMRTAEIERLALGCTGVKRTTGQHPGGIVVIPGYMDVFDFTPFQYPADDPTSAWRTTHFDYHSISGRILKLDILGHDAPTMIRMLEDITGIVATEIPLDDPETMSLFTSTEALGVTSEEIKSVSIRGIITSLTVVEESSSTP